MYLKDKKIFLAGATGGVGAGILQHLLRNYPDTRIKAAYSKTRPYIKDKKVEYVKADLRLQRDCRRASFGCDCAIMTAANTSGARILKTEPWQQVNDNLTMNSQMLEAFYFNKVNRVVFVSSATVYQEFQGYIKEDQLDLNIDPHPAYMGIGWVMRYIEKLCKFWHQQGMEIVIARATNPFGPYFKFNPKTSNFIPALIRKAVSKMDPFEIWGSPDVERDVLYVDDFACAIAMMLDNYGIKFDIFNVGSGTKTSVGDVAKLALKYAEHSPKEIKYIQDKPTTIKFRALDCAKARDLLGWRPQYSAEQGIGETVEWWIKHKDKWKK